MDKPLTLVEHLTELKKRIIVCLVALCIGIVVGFPLAPTLLKILKTPAQGLIEKLVFFSPQDAFGIYMRIAFILSLSLSMPIILYELWAFISPALEEKFRKNIVCFVLFCFSAFILGGLFAYFILIPPAVRFLLSFAKDELEPVISAQNYISFITALIFGCGLVFQMPVLSLLLSKIGIINARILRRKYKYAVAVIFIVAAIITPTTDIFNMLILALPMIFLYEISIWIAFFAPAKTVKEVIK